MHLLVQICLLSLSCFVCLASYFFNCLRNTYWSMSEVLEIWCFIGKNYVMFFQFSIPLLVNFVSFCSKHWFSLLCLVTGIQLDRRDLEVLFQAILGTHLLLSLFMMLQVCHFFISSVTIPFLLCYIILDFSIYVIQ